MLQPPQEIAPGQTEEVAVQRTGESVLAGHSMTLDILLPRGCELHSPSREIKQPVMSMESAVVPDSGDGCMAMKSL